jgi:hypothetical protein
MAHSQRGTSPAQTYEIDLKDLMSPGLQEIARNVRELKNVADDASGMSRGSVCSSARSRSGAIGT